jgi:anti-sigma factor RsiW
MNETHPSIEQIVDYLHGELPPAQDAAMHAHLAGCPPCDERRAEEAAIGEALRAHVRAAERELPAGIAQRIRDATERSRESAWERVGAFFRPIVLIPTAAAVAVALFLVGYGWHNATAPTEIDAASYVNDHAAMAAGAPFGDAAPPAVLTSSDEAP